MKKTNAIRLLARDNIPFETLTYDYDPDNLDVADIAQKNELELAAVYKTLMVLGDQKGLVVAVIPGDRVLNLKALAFEAGFKKMSLLPTKDLLAKTGYIRGGCSPIGLKKPCPVFIDQQALEWDGLFVNAGQRGIFIKIAPLDLQKACRGAFAQITNTT